MTSMKPSQMGELLIIYVSVMELYRLITQGLFTYVQTDEFALEGILINLVILD
jgi:hypothetical protein